jgi:transposase-like protein
MDLNPLTGTCAETQRQIDGLQQSEKQVAAELQWYTSIDPHALTENLRRNQAVAEKLQSEILTLDKEIQENAASFSETDSSIETLTSTFAETKREIDGLQENEKQAADELQWYSSIDPQTLTNDLREEEATAEKLQSQILSLEKEIQENAARLCEIAPAIGTRLNPFNWFAKDQVELRRRRAQLRETGNHRTAQRQSVAKDREDTCARMAKLTSDLQRHRSFDFARRQCDLRQIKQSLAGKKDEMAILADCTRRDREMLAHLREVGNQKAAHKKQNITQLEHIRERIANMSNTLQRHGSFDLHQRQSAFSTIKRSIARKNEELEILAERKQRIDELLAPLVQEMHRLESRRQSAEGDLGAAEDFDRQLSSADNSYERAMIHEQCERRFGEGSPRKIISERQREVRQLQRDYDKAKRRVEDIARKAARKIDTIVIDGNNLCYEGGTFISLAAIEALLPLLSRICAVVVVFDSAIRRLMNTDDSGRGKWEKSNY